MMSRHHTPTPRIRGLLLRAVLLAMPLLVMTHDLTVSMHNGRPEAHTAAHAHADEQRAPHEDHGGSGHIQPAGTLPCHAPVCPLLIDCGTQRVQAPSWETSEGDSCRLVGNEETHGECPRRSRLVETERIRATPGREILASHRILIV